MESRTREFMVPTAQGDLPCMMLEPADRPLAPESAILINVGTERQTMLTCEPYTLPGEVFLARGHRVLSFDLPHHGERISPHGQSLDGFREALLAGHDPFKLFVSDGCAVVDAILERGLASQGRVFLTGHSRGGYCALRLAAAEPRIAGVAAMATVTDWGALREFASVRDRPEVEALSLEHCVAGLAGRPIYVAIGNCDDRVSSACCARFVASLLDAEARQSLSPSHVSFHVEAGATGHSLPDRSYVAAGEYLLQALGASPAATPAAPGAAQ